MNLSFFENLTTPSQLIRTSANYWFGLVTTDKPYHRSLLEPTLLKAKLILKEEPHERKALICLKSVF